MTVELRLDDHWLAVCELSSLVPGRGVAALLPDGSQVAVFVDRAGAAPRPCRAGPGGSDIRGVTVAEWASCPLSTVPPARERVLP